ncbi:hypothetical protein D3C85_799010 [compost metagenome]
MVDQALGCLNVVWPPVVDDGGQHRLRPEVRHIRSVAHGIHAATFGGLDWRRAVGVLEHHVHALVDQCVGGIRFLARIEPGVDPHHLDFGTGVVLVQGQLDGVDVADHFRDRERGDVADLFGLGHLRREEAADVAALIRARQVSAEVLVLLVAGGVFEGHLGKLFGNFHRRVHVAEGGGEDQVVFVLGHVADHPLGVGPFGHVLHIVGGDLRAEFFRELLASLFMLIRPAVVADRADVNEADFQRVVGAGTQARAQADGGGNGAKQLLQRTVVHELELHFVLWLAGAMQMADQPDNKIKRSQPSAAPAWLRVAL